MEEQNQQELLTQARAFSSDFDDVVNALHGQLLQTIEQGIVQQPISYLYWYKKGGEENVDWRPDYAPDPDPKDQLYVGQWCYLKTHPDIAASEARYSRCCKALRNNPFEKTLKKFPDYEQYKFANISQKVSLHDDLKGSHDDTGLLRMACLRVLAGGIELYLDPLYMEEPANRYPLEMINDNHKDPTEIAVKAGLGTLVYPSDKTISAAKRLIGKIKEDGGAVDLRLEETAKGEPFKAAKRTVPVKAMVREMTLLSNRVLNTYNGIKNRFPPSAIQYALNIMDDQTSKVQISKYQAAYDESEEVPLSNINQDLVTRAEMDKQFPF